MVGPRVAMIGEVVHDEVVWEGRPGTIRRLGGGALYSAVGALVWGAQPEIHATVGDDFEDAEMDALQAAGMRLDTLTRIAGPGLALWMLYEQSGHRRQLPKAASRTMLTGDLARATTPLSPDVDGVHIAPQTTEGQLRALATARQSHVVTLDCMVESYIDLGPYRDGRALKGVSACLPGADEVMAIWGAIEPTQLVRHLREIAGVRWLIITRGSLGADVVEPERVTRVPIAPVVETDPTGAGDAFCGGFLVGLLEQEDPIRAAALGATSASFVVETHGVLEALAGIDRRKAEQRLASVLEQVSVVARAPRRGATS